MRIQFDAARLHLAEALQEDIENVPEYKVKTPLQRAVQVMKRHRDVVFADDESDRPISIIITTLAAHAYDNEADLVDAITNIVARMPRYIHRRDGVSWVENPVNHAENFADKWRTHPKREANFRWWLNLLETDLRVALQQRDCRSLVESFKPHFGDRAVMQASSDRSAGLSSAVVLSALDSSRPRVHISTPTKPWSKRH
jgi:hypothetical protein